MGARRWDDELVEMAPCGFIVLEAQGKVSQANATFLEWTGYREDELVGHRNWQDLLPVGDRVFWATHCTPLSVLQGAVMELSLSVKCSDGTRMPAIVNMRTRTFEGARQFLLTLFDATDRTSYEHELRSARDDAQRSEERLRSLATFTAGLIRTPTSSEVAEQLGSTAVVMLDVDWSMVWLRHADRIVPAREIDPDFADALLEAHASGVRILGRRSRVDRATVTLGEPVEVVLPAPPGSDR